MVAGWTTSMRSLRGSRPALVQNELYRRFLCHSSSDKPRVRRLFARLRSDGFDPWLDEKKLAPGQDWQLEIKKALRNSDVVVACLSKGWVTKTGFVQIEIKTALDVAEENQKKRFSSFRSG